MQPKMRRRVISSVAFRHSRLCHLCRSLNRSGKRPAMRSQRMPLDRQRWHAKSTFSQHNRRLRSALTNRATPAHDREIILRVLTRNLALLH